MKTMLPKILMLRSIAIMLLAAVCAPASAAETNAVAIPRSVFVDDPKHGTDPFFPKSTRRLHTLVQTRTNSAPSAARKEPPKLWLKGISGSKTEPLALINNVTVGVGETADIRAGTEVVKVHCREIRVRSVLIEINGTGQLEELSLRDGI